MESSLSRKEVGIYTLSGHRYRLYADFATRGGSFDTIAADGLGEVVVGVATTDWAEIVCVLTHEVMELAFTDLNRRYRPSVDIAGDNGNFLFVLTHTEFAEAVARASGFMAKALPDLCTVYKEGKQDKQGAKHGKSLRTSRNRR